MKNLRFNEDNFVGKGGIWSVYKDITSGNKAVVIKSCKCKSNSKAQGNINNYELIKSLKLPTLKFLSIEKIQDEYVLVAEDLNAGEETIFVTPNISLPISPETYSSPLIDFGLIMLEEQNTKRLKDLPIAEKFRFENKLSEISNFKNFTDELKSTLQRLSERQVVVEYDSYFFGSKKNEKTSDITYLIADFDNIYFCKDKHAAEVFELNMGELRTALNKFISAFVEENNAVGYLKIISNLI